MLSKEEQDALPNPGEQVLTSSGATVVNESDFFKHIQDSGVWPGNIVAIKGWFEKTVPEFASVGEPISILRLDGDLYNSTYVCLKHLYPLVESGGIVIIDDWQLPGCQLAVMDYIHDTNLHSFDINFPKIQFISNITYFIKP